MNPFFGFWIISAVNVYAEAIFEHRMYGGKSTTVGFIEYLAFDDKNIRYVWLLKDIQWSY